MKPHYKIQLRQEQINSMTLDDRHRLFSFIETSKKSKELNLTARDREQLESDLSMVKQSPDWTEPEKWDCTAKWNTSVDGISVSEGETVKLYIWQYLAVSRHFTLSEKHTAIRDQRAEKAVL